MGAGLRYDGCKQQNFTWQADKMGIEHKITKKRRIAEIAARLQKASTGGKKPARGVVKGKSSFKVAGRVSMKQRKELNSNGGILSPPKQATQKEDSNISDERQLKKLKTGQIKSREEDDAGNAADSSRAVGAATGCAFDELQLEKPLCDTVLAGVAALNFVRTTPVQQVTIPLLLSNKDVAVQACTGSGKTAAFLIPAFELLLRSEETWRPRDVGAIIIAPTRELATQIMSVAQVIADEVQTLALLALTGGSDNAESTRQLLEEGGNIIVGTPGRLEHTLTTVGALQVKKLELLILDEADRLLDMGFQASLNTILAKLPKQRRTGLFSATMGSEVEALARAGLRNPRQVKVSVQGRREQAQSTPLQLQNEFVLCPEHHKLAELVRFLHLHADKKVMVYLLTCAQVDYFAKLLPLLPELQATQFESLHGKMVQKRRSKTYENFSTRERGCLLCTDVAARGLDIPDVDWIFQFDAPQDPSFFIHRVGRTARFGREGRSVVLLAPHEDAYVNFLTLRKVPLRQLQGRADDSAARALQAQIRSFVRSDLDLHQGGQKAFVSLVRAYREHQCNFIFQLEKLSLGGVAFAMGLLRLPKMPELSGLKVTHFSADSSVDISTLSRYKDKAREKARRMREEKRVSEEAEEAEARGEQRVQRIKNLPWSHSNKKLANKLKQEEKAVAKQKKRRGGEGQGNEEESAEDDFEAEARLLKKLKRGQISKAEFDRLLAAADDLDSD